MFRPRFFAAALLFLPVILCCDDSLTDDPCLECYYEKPFEAEMRVLLTFNEEIDSVPLVIFHGRIEDSVPAATDTAVESPYKLWLNVEGYYSVRAEYRLPQRTVYAVDGVKMEVKNAKWVCDTTCWLVNGDILKAELKADD